MALPRLELKPGISGHMTTGPNYTDLTKMTADIIEGMREYPEASLLLTDDLPQNRWGYCLEITEDGLWRRWEFYIGLDDFRRTLGACLKAHPEWSPEDFKTLTRRAAFADKLMAASKEA